MAWATARATDAKAKPRVCIECKAKFTRLYRDINGRPRLRELRLWPRSLYCSRSCASAYRKRKRTHPELPPHLRMLEPPGERKNVRRRSVSGGAALA